MPTQLDRALNSKVCYDGIYMLHLAIINYSFQNLFLGNAYFHCSSNSRLSRKPSHLTHSAGFAGMVTAVAAWSIWGTDVFPAQEDPKGSK